MRRELFFEMDGRFPNHHPDPTVPQNLQALMTAVREQGRGTWGSPSTAIPTASAPSMRRGEAVYGDQLMLIYAREILSRKPGATFIGEVKCSQTLYDGIKALGGNGIMWKTGHSLIKAKMKEEHAELAGEMSGHMFFADRYHGFDDALYAACRLLEIVSKSGKPLSAQLADVPKTVSTPEIRVDCADEEKFGVVERVTAHFRKLYPVIDVDGVRILFPTGWGWCGRRIRSRCWCCGSKRRRPRRSISTGAKWRRRFSRRDSNKKGRPHKEPAAQT